MTNIRHIPKRRFPGFEGEWEEKKLGEVVEKFDNLRIPVASKDRIAGNIPYYGANGIQDYVEGFTHDGEFILLAEDGANDLKDYPVQYVNGKVWVNNHAHVIQGKNNLIDNKFLLFAIKQIQMEPYLVGGGRAKLNAEIMMNLPLTAPGISEQRMIGEFLMKVEKQISLQQQKLDKLKNLKKSYLAELFPAEGERVPKRRFPGFEGEWEEKKLGEVVEKFDNLRIPVASKDRIAGNIPYYGANGIQDYVEGFTHDGEFILLAEDGANDLKDYPVQYVNGKVWVNNHAHVIQGKNNLIDNKFLLFAIKQIQMEPYLVGGGRAKLNAEIMMNLPLTAPGISEQRMIGEFLMKVEKQIFLQQQKLDKLKDLKKAYLNELFV